MNTRTLNKKADNAIILLGCVLSVDLCAALKIFDSNATDMDTGMGGEGGGDCMRMWKARVR